MPRLFKKKSIQIITLSTLSLLVVVGVWFGIQAWRNPHFTQAQLGLPDGSQITVEVADSWREQARGLMGRESLAAETGMLFVFDLPAQYPFWMKNTKMDLDYVWMLQGVVVDLSEEVPAGDGLPKDQIARVIPKTEVDWVLEVPAGFIAQHQLQAGDRLMITDGLDETLSVF